MHQNLQICIKYQQMSFINMKIVHRMIEADEYNISHCTITWGVFWNMFVLLAINTWHKWAMKQSLLKCIITGKLRITGESGTVITTLCKGLFLWMQAIGSENCQKPRRGHLFLICL